MPRDAFAGGTGLSNSMSPGGISRLLQSEAIAFRVRFAGAPPGNQSLYWRGPVFGGFDGSTWSPLLRRLAAQPPLRIDADPASAIDYTVTLEPSQRDWLFALEMPASLPEDADLRPRASSDGQLLAGRLITAAGHHGPRRTRRSDPPPAQQALLVDAPAVLRDYVQALVAHAPGRGTARLKRLLQFQRTYPTEPFLAAVTQALTYGLYDLTRLESLILKQVRGAFFQLRQED
jgi:hypothetical protein